MPKNFGLQTISCIILFLFYQGEETPMAAAGVQLDVQDDHVIIDNGIVQVALTNPGGILRGIKYGGIDNLLELNNTSLNGGFWDLNWSEAGSPGTRGMFDTIQGTSFKIIVENDEQVELSFTRIWSSSVKGEQAPLSIDRRFIVLEGFPGLYSYAIFEHLKDMPGFHINTTRIAFMLRKDKFRYMAVADNRQRQMPLPDDRMPPRGQPLAYPEAVLLVDPIEPDFEGEVDDKYQYSLENYENRVHGWICADPPVGFWLITPSNEFRNGGPPKQDLTSHVNPTTLAIFHTSHYAGEDLLLKFEDGEIWKKVLGPVCVYLNSAPDGVEPQVLWDDAKEQMNREVESWPYTFLASDEFPTDDERGSVSGSLLVLDRYVGEDAVPAAAAFVGLAAPGNEGSWQRESKGYQFWTIVDSDGYFVIQNIHPGDYNLYAWVPGYIGDYKYATELNISAGCEIKVDELVYMPPRDGPTIWEIGFPDRSAAEFYIPDPNPKFINKLYVNHPDRFRQYGLWERYADLYPDEDLIYNVGVSEYSKDWFFAQVTRKIGDASYKSTTWQIKFNMDNVEQTKTYKLRIALASAHNSNLEVRINDVMANPPLFSTGSIGSDNAIARHGIHGLYWLFSVGIPGSKMLEGENNTIFLTQAKSSSPFQGVMYDYIRLEGPSSESSSRKELQYDHHQNNRSAFNIFQGVLNWAMEAPVQLLVQDDQVVVDNGIVQLTLSNPGGTLTRIQYGGIDNLLELSNPSLYGGFWDLNWSAPGSSGTRGKFDTIKGTTFEVVVESDEQVELSFTRKWNPSLQDEHSPLTIDKRFILLQGCSGFYSYAIYEHNESMPAFNLNETRIAFMLKIERFLYMALSDERQRHLPLPEDRLPPRGQELAYPEAVLLVDPVESEFKGEVDDKYQYSCENKDNKVHGFMCLDPPVGFWQITPSNEFRTGGPIKQDLTSHVNPTTLAMFVSTHYGGEDLVIKFEEGEPWKKVFGPVFIYLNSVDDENEAVDKLWDDAKRQMNEEVESWPYSFPSSEEFPKADQRGSVTGRLLVQDRYICEELIPADGAHIGLAPPGKIGSFQRENKGYQFWTQTDSQGNFSIDNIAPGTYSTYAWVPGFLGDYQSQSTISITPGERGVSVFITPYVPVFNCAGCRVDMGDAVFMPPREGPTLWEIGIPDRSAAEFYIPDPNPSYINKLFTNLPEHRFRQYGLWERYAELYPDGDLVYTVGTSDYHKDWFYAHVNRKTGNNTFQATTWQIRFQVDNVVQPGTYTLRIALSSATVSELQVRVNEIGESPPHFSSGVIGSDNAIARHGIRGLYWLFSADILDSQLKQGNNTIYLTQAENDTALHGIMYDYIRLESPPTSDNL